jgi:hypothetical protein
VHDVGVGRIAGVARDEKLTKDNVAEDELGGHAAVRVRIVAQSDGPLATSVRIAAGLISHS